jgi:sialidase-1
VLEPKLKTERDDQKRCGLAREIARAGDHSRAVFLLDILAKKDSHGHVHAAESLYKIGEVGDGGLLRQAMAQDKDPILKVMAAAALARCGSPQALAVVRDLVKNDKAEISSIAAWVLGRLGDRSDLPALHACAERTKDPSARFFSENAQPALGDGKALPMLTRNLSAKDTTVRAESANAAGEARITSVANRLVQLLDDPALDVRIRAAQALITLALPAPPDRREDVRRDVYPASAEHPRYSEGSIVELHDGSLLYATTEFSGTTSDFARAHIIAKASKDGGRTWGPARVLQENVGKLNVLGVTLRRLANPVRPGTPVSMLYSVTESYSDLKFFLRQSPDEGRTFGPPVVVSADPGYLVMNNDRTTVLSSGRILCPDAWTSDQEKENHYVSFCYLSDDGGKTWRKGKGKVDQPKRGAMEPEVVELTDGRVLMIVRNQLGHIAASHSSDGGDTWDAPVAWDVKSPESPATLRRIPSTGDLLLIWNNAYTPGSGHGGMRTPLTAAVSSDDGRTWKHHRNLEDNPEEGYAYTSITFVGGRVLLSYYVDAGKPRRISSRFRSLPIEWFYGKP